MTEIQKPNENLNVITDIQFEKDSVFLGGRVVKKDE